MCVWSRHCFHSNNPFEQPALPTITTFCMCVCVCSPPERREARIGEHSAHSHRDEHNPQSNSIEDAISFVSASVCDTIILPFIAHCNSHVQCIYNNNERFFSMGQFTSIQCLRLNTIDGICVVLSKMLCFVTIGYPYRLTRPPCFT